MSAVTATVAVVPARLFASWFPLVTVTVNEVAETDARVPFSSNRLAAAVVYWSWSWTSEVVVAPVVVAPVVVPVSLRPVSVRRERRAETGDGEREQKCLELHR